MSMLLENVFDVVVGSAMLLIFMRFMLEFASLEPKEPLAKPIFAFTRIVDVFGRIFPTIGDKRINTAALALMFLLRVIFLWGTALLDSKHLEPFRLFFVANITLILDFITMCQWILSVSVVASLVIMLTQSENPLWGFIMQLAEPIIAPFRKLIPPMGMFDMAFMAAYASLYLLEIFVKIIASNLLHL